MNRGTQKYNDDDLTDDTRLIVGDCGEYSRGIIHSNNTDARLVKTIDAFCDCDTYVRFAKISLSASLQRSKVFAEQFQVCLTTTDTTTTSNNNHNNNNIRQRQPLDDNMSSMPQQVDTIFQLVSLLPQSMRIADLQNYSKNKAILGLSSVKDASLKQLKKDVERDKLLINKARISGNEMGLEGIQRYLTEVMAQELERCHLSTIDHDLANTLSLEVLRKASRTHSGAVAYQYLQFLLKEDDVEKQVREGSPVMIVPVSTLAQPMAIDVAVSSIKAEGAAVDSWGLSFDISCSTFFSLTTGQDLSAAMTTTETATMSQQNSTSQETVVRVLYENSVAIELDVLSSRCVQSLDKLQGQEQMSGKITIMCWPTK